MSSKRYGIPFGVLLAAVLLLPGGALSSGGANAAGGATTALAAPPRQAVTNDQPAVAPSHDPASAAAAGRLMFIENAGQFPDGARFQARGRDFTLWLAEDAIWLTLFDRTAAQSPTVESGGASAGSPPSRGPGVNIKLTLLGANPHPRLEPFNRLETHVSFFTGSDSAKWQAGVPAWGGVRYVELYPGIDLEFTGEQGELVPRLAARPGADLSGVRLRVDGVEAAEVEGDTLRLTTSAAGAAFRWPLLRAQGMTAEPSVRSLGALSFDVITPFAQAQPSRQAEIQGLRGTPPLGSSADPPIGDYRSERNEQPGSLSDLYYGTFLGGSADDPAFGIAVDGSGAAYVTGWTFSSDFPTTPGAFDTTQNQTDAFVAKLNPAGSALVYATFLGGPYGDKGQGIAVDEAGAAYVTGWTDSPDFPITPGAFDTSYNGGDSDAFVVKVNPSGTVLDYATFLGTDYYEWGDSIAVDESGAAYVTGTAGWNFPTTPGAFDTTPNGGGDAFVAKLNPAGSVLAYATFLGGSSSEWAGWRTAIAVDGSGAAYVTGQTASSDFPATPGAFDTTHNGSYDAFVAKLNTAGSNLDYATFLGGIYEDFGQGVAVDDGGTAYVTGVTSSAGFPTTPGAFDTTYDNRDGFVVKLNAAGSALDYGTFLGGGWLDDGQSIAVDQSGAAYVTGRTSSPNFPTTPCALDTRLDGEDAFAVKLNAQGSVLSYGTFLGGSGNDWGMAIAVDESGAAYVTGYTKSSDLPTTPSAFDTSYNGGMDYGDAYAVKLTMGSGPYAISGRVTDASGGGIPGVAVSAGGTCPALTDASGNYVISNLITGTYSLTPTLPGYRFDPATRTADLPPDAAGQDFVGTVATYSITGQVTGPGNSPLPGVTIWTKGGRSAVTDVSGAYSLTALVPGSYALAPSLEGYRFSPATRGVNVPPDATGQNFVGTFDLSDLLYSTFLGGSVDEIAYGIAVDGSGAAYVTGYSYSSDFPTTPGAFDTSATNRDIFLVKLNPAGSDLDYATFVGGSNHDSGYDIAVDGSGAAYVAGTTDSYDFPTTPGAFDTSFNSGQYDTDAFAIKVSADGTDLAYATYLGGSYNDNGAAIAVDGSGAAYVTGWTGSDYHSGSSDFPITPGAFDTTHNGGGDAFVARLNAAGSALDYATFLGGNDMDAVCGIAVDASGAAYVTGWTGSANFPTTPGAFDTTRTGGLYEGFVAKLNAAGSALDYATFLGGSSDEQGFDIAVDGSGAAYVAGTTGSSDFPTTPGAFDTSFNGPTGAWGDAFVVKLNAAGSALDYGTFLGGSSQDAGQGIAVDGSGAAYVTGWAGSAELPTTCGAFDRSYNGNYDLFVAKLNTAGSALDYATFLGGGSQDGGGGDYDRPSNGIAVDGSGRVYVTGTTASSDFPTTPAAFDTSYNGGDADVFVAKLSIGAPYAICGRVTDTGGQGISDVTVSAGPGGSAISGTSGDFTINNLSTGTYTLTPTLEGRRFDPITRSVDVPPDADGQDFELVPFSVYLPLVLRNH